MNAEKIAVTGKKLDDKMYYRHSGYPGGLKSRPLRDELERRPDRGAAQGRQGHAPAQPPRARPDRKLKIYAGPEHPHEAQAPEGARR